MTPHTGVSVFAKAFIVKAVDLGNLSGLLKVERERERERKEGSKHNNS
jgi:hypothetical protein